MNKAVPWRIKGVGFDARAAAMEAARRSGMSLGEWLNTVIAEQAADDDIDEGELGADDRIHAVTRQLAKLRDGDGPRTREHRERTNRRSRSQRDVPSGDRVPDNFYGERDNHDAVRQPGRAEALDRPDDEAPRVARAVPSASPDPFREQINAEALLENAIAAFDRRANRSSERTARALAEVADLIDATHRERERDDAALSTIADRLAHIEKRVASEKPTPVDPSIHTAIARLERRIEGIGRDAAARESRDEEKRKARQASPPPSSPPSPAPAAAKRPLALAIAEVAKRQQELDGEMPAPAFASVRATPFRVPEAVPSALERRLAALVDRLEQGSQAKAAVSTGLDLSGLRGNIDTLTDRIEKMRVDLASRDAAAPRREIDGIAEIRRELAGLARTVADLAPRASVTALEGAVRDLSARVADSRIDGVGEPALAPVEALVRELLGVVRSTDPRAAIESLDRGIRVVAAKLEAFDGATVADPDLARGIAEQTREMRDILARIQANQLPAERIERSLSHLAASVEAIATSGADPLGRGEMAQRVGEIRAMLSDPAAQERTLQMLERRLETIAGRIDAVFVERFDSMQRTVAAELDRTRVAPGPSVDTLVHDLGTRIDTALTGGLKAMERTIARLVDAKTTRTDETPSRLEEMVRDLSARLDAGAAPSAAPGALDAIARQVQALSEHLDRGDRAADTLVGVQKSVAELFTRLEQVQEVGRDGDENDADTMRELSTLRAQQDAADHRTQVTLTAVHDTLSQVVDRLSSLEDDLADVRDGAGSTASAYAPPPLPTTRYEEVADTYHARRSANATVDAADLPRHRDDEDALIEPGTRFDRRNRTPAEDDQVAQRPQASFIQAARRAAQAAVSDAPREPSAPRTGSAKGSVTPLDQVRAYYASRKRPILLSLAALMVIFGAWQVARIAVDERPPPPAPAPMQAPKTSAVAPREKVADAVLPPVAIVAPEAAPARKADALPVAPEPAPPSAAIDRAPVGSINQPAQTVDTNGIVRALAVSGDTAAQYELAVRYADGKLLARDLKLSKEWFEKAAAKGVVPAQYRLGALYERGVGVTKDPAQAKAWYLRAADAGNARAMHNLAVLFADGADGKPNYGEAIIWFKRAAEYGVRDSQYNLAILYARGLGTGVNMPESYLWFAAAAAQGDEDSAKKRDDVAGRLQPNDLARAKASFASYKAKPLDAAANEITPPPGGWEAMKPPPRPDQKTTARPKISSL